MRTAAGLGLALALAACAAAPQGIRLAPDDGPEAWSASENAGKTVADLEKLLGRQARFGDLGRVQAVLLDGAYLAALRAARPDAATIDVQEGKAREVDEFSRYVKDGKLCFRITFDLEGLPAAAGDEGHWEAPERWRLVLDGVPGRPGLKPERVTMAESALGTREATGPDEAPPVGGRLVLDAMFRVGIDKLDSGAALVLAVAPADAGTLEATARLRWRILPAE